MAKQNYGGVYANMEFAPYQYQAYPRHIPTGDKGEYEVVFNEEEEVKVRAKLRKQFDDVPAEIEAFTADPEKEILISRARELEVPINRKWSKEKLIATLKAAEDAIDNLPPEGAEDEEPATEPTATVNGAGIAHIADVTTVEEVDDKEALLAKAKELGIKAQGMHLWGVPRLQATISEFLAAKA